MSEIYRRTFLKIGALSLTAHHTDVALSSAFESSHHQSESRSPKIQYALADSLDGAIVAPSSGLHIPFGWKAAGISHSNKGDAVYLKWSEPIKDIIGSVRLRISVAVNVREEMLVEVFLAESKRLIGTFDIKYSAILQPYEILLSSSDANLAVQEGVGLRVVKGSKTLWIFGPDRESKHSNVALLPHLIFSQRTNSLAEFYDRMFSDSTLQSFGWMEGCVLDGILDLQSIFGKDKAHKAARLHLNKFFDQENKLNYTTPGSTLSKSIYGIEGLLPFAALAKVSPKHPALQTAIDFCLSRVGEDGSILDGKVVSTEGCYTVGYTLAALAQTFSRKDLADLAIKQLLIRKAGLVTSNAIAQRSNESGKLELPNWGRGVAWYMLGLVRCLCILKKDSRLGALKEEFGRVANWSTTYQQPNGLWSCFIDQPATGIDTSGSAGIAAALAIGVKYNLLPKTAHAAAIKAHKGLMTYLTPDGLLTGVTQINRGGEALQRSGYRVIAQFGMGMMAQLSGALYTSKS